MHLVRNPETLDQAHIPSYLLHAVDHTVQKYDMAPDGRLAAALSGGEDSVFMVAALRRIGVEVGPILYADMGWQPGKGEQLRNRFARHGIEVHVIDIARSLNTQGFYDQPVEVEIRNRVDTLKEMTRIGIQDVIQTMTPCTTCHGTKLRAFEAALNSEALARELDGTGVQHIALGYNRDDARAAFLRGAAYLEDYLGTPERPGNPTYQRSNLLQPLAELEKALVRLPNSLDVPYMAVLKRMVERVEKGILDADDVPNAPLIHGEDWKPYRMVSPLWTISKFTEIHPVASRFPLEIEGSECAHGTPGTETPRDLALEIVRRCVGRYPGLWLDELIRRGINDRGDSIHYTRGNRDRILKGYKQKPKGGDKH